tara:strand:- start:361 stop:1260 length:900 start_codon:yes stop_codon:yes gene_type:complete
MGEDERTNGYLKIMDLYSSPSGLPSAIDIFNNRLVLLAPGSVTGESIGMTKAGRSERLRNLAERLIADEAIEEALGRKPVVTIFKPNSLAKNLFEKDPEKRAIFHEYICNLHRNTLLELRQPSRQGYDVHYTDVALFDRGPHDDIFWSYALEDAGLINSARRERALEIAGWSTKEKLVDMVFGINVPPARALERENKRGEGFGNVMNPEFLPVLEESYMGAEREERIRKGLASNLERGEITAEDYKEQTKDFLVQCPYVSVNGEDFKTVNSNKFFYPLKGQLLYNHGVSEELEHLAENK